MTATVDVNTAKVLLAYMNGIVRLNNALLQCVDRELNIPLIMIPATTAVRSLYASMVKCESGYRCNACMDRNECMRSILIKIDKALKKASLGKIGIDKALEFETNVDELPLYDGYREAVHLVRQVIVEMGT